jgi:hypothetical protein
MSFFVNIVPSAAGPSSFASRREPSESGRSFSLTTARLTTYVRLRQHLAITPKPSRRLGVGVRACTAGQSALDSA